MRYLQGFERMMAGLMMLMVILLCGDIWLTMDRRQVAFEKKMTGSIDAMSVKLNGTVGSKLDDLNKKLDPVTTSAKKTLDAATVTLNASTKTIRAVGTTVDTVNGKAKAFDVPGLNTSVAAIGPAFTAAGTALTYTAKSVGTVTNPLSASITQVNTALPDFLDCQVTDDGIGNKGCIYARLDDLSSEADQTMLAIAQAAPKTATAIAGMTQDGHAITKDVKRWVDNETKPPTTWERVKDYGEIVLFAVLRAMGL